MLTGFRAITTRATLLLLGLMLTACGAEQPASPTSPPDSWTGTTPTTAASTSTTPSGAENGDSRVGIDMSKADPCALLMREEAEAVLGPLEWNPYAHPLNDSAFKMKCEFDRPFQGSTPDKSLAVRLDAPNGWQTDYNDLERGDAALISPQEVGLGGIAPIGAGNSISAKLPALCNATLPCVIAKNGDEWLTLTILLPDRSALQLELNPRNVDYAKQLAGKLLERLPMK